MKLLAGCVTTLLAALVSAGPAIRPNQARPDNGVVTQGLCLLAVSVCTPANHATGITSTELTMFKLMSQYAGATYCYQMFRGVPGKMSCSQDKGVCPLVESANSTNIHPYW